MQCGMIDTPLHPRLQRRLLDALYTDAMLLADEARHYVDLESRDESERLAPIDRVLLSCESLRVTTRLMHVLAWLLLRRAVDNGELAPAEALAPSRRLGPATMIDSDTLARLPERARWLTEASEALYRRAAILDEGYAAAHVPDSPARAMQQRLFERL